MNKNIAVVGAGYWGKNLVRNFHKLGVLHTICDTDLEVAVKQAQKYALCNTTNKFDWVLNNKEIEGVVIATPAKSHHAMAMKAIEAGKDVFIEKPMALSAKDGREIVGKAEMNGQIVLVGHVLEYHPAVMKLLELVHYGKLGALRYMYSNRLNLGKFRTEENILWSFAPHDIAVMLSITGSMPEGVVTHMADYITPGVADVTVTGLTFPLGVKGHIHVSWLHPFKEQKMVVIGDKAMAVFNDMAQDKLLLYHHSIGYDNDIPFPEARAPEVVPVSLDEPMKLECLDFLEAITERRQPLVDGNKGVQVLEVLEMCQSAAKEAG